MYKYCYMLAITVVLLSSFGTNGQYARRQVPYTPSPATSALDASYTEIREKAKITAEALVRGDFNTVADYTYPKVLKLLGGRSSMIATTAREMRNLQNKGFTVKSVSVREPNKLEIIGKQIFSIVPTTLTMTVPDGSTMLVESFLVAVSEDDRKTWTFVDGTIAGDKRMLRQIFPLAANRLKFPPKKTPVIYKDGTRG